MQPTELLSPGKFYHIYNRGINSCNVFNENANYQYFLRLYEKYISPVADTYAWVLMKNHFHFLVRIKEEIEYQDLTGFGNLSGLKSTSPPPHQYFSNLFNAYAKAYNKTYTRHGNLFERPFKRKLIEDPEYFKTVVVYIHNNPVHHGFTNHAVDYPWSSYLTCISVKPTHLKRDEVMSYFDSTTNFIITHEKHDDINDLENWLGL
jgi:REP element-mobilizing transposase RayT